MIFRTFLGIKTRGLWSRREAFLHINVLEPLVVKFALLSLIEDQSIQDIHFEIDNMTVIRYQTGGGGVKNTKKIIIST